MALLQDGYPHKLSTSLRVFIRAYATKDLLSHAVNDALVKSKLCDDTIDAREDSVMNGWCHVVDRIVLMKIQISSALVKNIFDLAFSSQGH